MPIFVSKTKVALQETERRGRLLADELRQRTAANDDLIRVKASLEAQVQKGLEVQELLTRDILTLQEVSASYTGNDYPKYEGAVKAISEKYTGTASWGCLQTRSVIDLRAAFILGEGVKIVKKTPTKAEAQAELDWANAFFKYNGLDAEMAQEIAKEAEIEGKIALRLFWDAKPDNQVSVRFLSWYSKKYKVECDPEDYLWYKKLTWNAQAASPAGNVAEPEFVYKKFGGRLNDPNDAQPRIMTCLTLIDRLDRALRDLREINHLFASQTPDFECDTAEQATQLLGHIDKTNWKIGKAIVHIGRFNLKGPDPAGIQNLISEIEMTVKMISGQTGVPIHYLGLLDLLKNRATGNDMRELIQASTSRERAIWIGAFEELLEKAMAMYNEKTGLNQKTKKLDIAKIGIEIPQISEQQWTNIQNVLIPAVTAGIVSKEFVASQIPGVDQEEEAARAEKAEASELEQAKADLERMRQESASKEIAGGGAGA